MSSNSQYILELIVYLENEAYMSGVRKKERRNTKIEAEMHYKCTLWLAMHHCTFFEPLLLFGKEKNSEIKETMKSHYFAKEGCHIVKLWQIVNMTKRIIKLNVFKAFFELTSIILIEGMEDIPKCPYCFAAMDNFGED